MQIRNKSKNELSFAVGQKDGEPVIDSVKAGETKNIDVKPTSVVLQARVHAGLVEVINTKSLAPSRPKPEAPAD